MSGKEYRTWKEPFKDAINYIDPCPPGTYLVRGYLRKSDDAIVAPYCKKGNKRDAYNAEIRETNVTVVTNTQKPKITHEKGYIVTGFNSDGISISEDYFSTKEEAEKHKRMIEKGDYY